MSTLKNTSLLTRQLDKSGLVGLLALFLVVIAILWGKSEYTHAQRHKEDKELLKEAKADFKAFDTHCKMIVAKQDSIIHILYFNSGKKEVLKNAK